MPIENRDLTAGTRLVARYKGKEHVCEVVQTEDGIAYRLEGKDYNSPSSAGRVVTGGVAVNGWRFWSLDGELKPAREKKAAKAPKTTTAAKTPAKRATKAPAKPKAAKKGGKAKSKAAKKAARAASKAEYGCGACGASFPTMKAATEHALTHTTA